MQLKEKQLMERTFHVLFMFVHVLMFCFFLQKADGTCNTNFKKTKHKEQVMQALEDFVGGNTQILVSWLVHCLFSVIAKKEKK